MNHSASSRLLPYLLPRLLRGPSTLSALFAVVFLLSATTSCQLRTESGSAEERAFARLGIAPETPLPGDPEVREVTLDNGLRIFLRSHPEPAEEVQLRFVLGVGSLVEEDGQQGLAHFIEHMAFNGTPSFPGEELMDTVRNLGGDFSAHTTHTATVYRLRLPTTEPATLDLGLRTLGEWAKSISFLEPDIERERGVVIAEWRGQIDHSERIAQQQTSALFAGSRYAERPPIGQIDILRTASRGDLLRFYERWYRPHLAAVAVVGDIDVDEVEAKLRRHLEGPWRETNDSSPATRPTFPIPQATELRVAATTDPEWSQTAVNIGTLYDFPIEATYADARQNLVSELYGVLLTQRLEELIEKGDNSIRYGQAATAPMLGAQGALTLAAHVGDGEIEAALQTLAIEDRRAALYGFTEAELERALQFLQRYAEQEVSREVKSSELANGYVRNFLYGETLLPSPQLADTLLQLLPTITVDEVNHQSHRWSLFAPTSEGSRSRHPFVIVTAPEELQGSLPTSADVEALLAAVAQLPIEARKAPRAQTIEPAPESVMLSVNPVPGTIVDERRVEDLGLTEWILSNGIEVVLKTMPGNEGPVRLQATSPGGYATAPKDQLLTARLAKLVVSGAGDLSEAELERLFDDRDFMLHSNLDRFTEGFWGRAYPGELETLFQVLYLRATEPRLNVEAFQQHAQRRRTRESTQTADPSLALTNEIIERSHQDHPFYRVLLREDYEGIDPQSALAFYRERFSDLSDLRVILVGNVNPDALRPLVTTYLASLPGSGRIDEPRSVPYPARSGKRFMMRQGVERFAKASINYRNPLPWDDLAHVHFDSLREVFSLRLNRQLREERGGTYQIRISSRPQDSLPSTYSLSINFESSPASVEGLVDDVFAVAEQLRNEGPSTEELTYARQQVLSKREGLLESSFFWTNALANHYRQGVDPRQILTYPERAAALTPGDLQRAAYHLLAPEGSLTGIQLPESSEGRTQEEGREGSLEGRR
ncbi:MAG: insulinase family protein [Acidobacteriota bacterium]